MRLEALPNDLNIGLQFLCQKEIEEEDEKYQQNLLPNYMS